MPPKLSLLQFNRIVALSKRFLDSFEPTVKQLEALSPSQAKNQAEYLNNSGKAELRAFDDAVQSYLSVDAPCEGLSEEVLQDSITEVRSRFNQLLCVINRFLTANVPLANSTQFDHSANANNSCVVFPKFKLSSFSGNYAEFDSFYTRFETLVHEHTALSGCQKFEYLLTHLEGVALDVVRHLPFTEANYETALRLLKDRFSNDRRALGFHAGSLLGLPKLSNSAPSIRGFLDQYQVHFSSLENLLKTRAGVHVQDVTHVHYFLSKFPSELRDEFERQVAEKEFITIDHVLSFLKNHVRALENASSSFNVKAMNSSPASSHNKWTNKDDKKSFKGKNSTLTSLVVACDVCPLCSSSEHKVLNCDLFISSVPRERYKLAKSKNICIRCLMPKHTDKCSVASGCNSCGSKTHHTLLHYLDDAPDKATGGKPPEVKGALTCMTCDPVPSRTSVLMATAIVRLQVSPTRYIVARAILDSASHASFITEHVAQALKCSRLPNDAKICGIGRSTTVPNGQCSLDVCRISGQLVVPAQPFYILPHISTLTPREVISPAVTEAVKCFVLADPTFCIPAPVDVLLGADVLASSIIGSCTPLGPGMPMVMLTAFGAVFCGSAPVAPTMSVVEGSAPSNPLQSCHAPLVSLAASPDQELVDNIHKLWCVDEPPSVGNRPSPQELLCEKHFNDTTVRLDSGRYQVRLPLVEGGGSLLGDSYGPALSRLRSLERKFQSDSKFKDLYVQFMVDYQAKGHMLPVLDPKFPRFYIPHHGIYKNRGDTSKIRVVFDASAKSSSSRSLNSILLEPPNVISLLSDILTLFRIHLYAFSCDIEQMYRQILVHEQDRAYQCILWREDPSQPVGMFALATVTYGVGPSAYQAISVLKRLARDECHRFPKAAQVLLKRVFVDDIGAGGCDITKALQLRDELISLLAVGGFCLKKWSSNSPELLSGIPSSDCLPLDSSRILGLPWDRINDSFKYPVEEMILMSQGSVTKRSVLAQTAKLFDPCGFIAPLIMFAKCFFQKLWRLSLDWDDHLPTGLSKEWSDFQCLLSQVSEVSISRPLVYSARVQIHGFSDASQSGYAAVVYVTSECDGHIKVSLLAAKTRVAPLRVLSIPRLELLAAHLMGKLVRHYVDLLSPECCIEEVILWTDSSIVLDWIHMEPHLLKTFVANRVADILDLTDVKSWRHIPGVLNPADMASRGLTRFSPEEFSLWCSGPPFLKLCPSHWPATIPSRTYQTSDLELKSKVVTLVAAHDHEFIHRFSTWNKAVRFFTLVAKWIHIKKRSEFTYLRMRRLGLNLLLKYIQRFSFSEDICSIEKGKCASPSVQRLAPFIDCDGIVRIKGRLTNMVGNKRLPILLPKNHHLVTLLIRHYHVGLGHAGPSLTQYQISWSYWILSARQIIRKIIHQCVTCFRASPRPTFPLMGDLPKFRVEPSPPFWHTGMDFCGPFIIKPYALRKAPLVKSYLCIFICMSTKCVHLEIAHDLSTQAFIDTLKRFVARRGMPSRLYSDCGTNFIGARTYIQKELRSVLSAHRDDDVIKNYFLDNNIEFETIPPHAPHQGGLWERAVQSAKFHLKRVVGSQVLTLSQFVTLASQVEAILNSRPLTPMSSDAGDSLALTPAHFLIGRPLTTFPEEDLAQTCDGLLRHYQLIRAMTQRFWAQWRLEYLSTLQARSKWTKTTPNLCVGDVVIVSEPNCPPLMWPLGKIVKVYPGHDQVVRRVLVKTKDGTYERPSVKVFRLPMAEGANN